MCKNEIFSSSKTIATLFPCGLISKEAKLQDIPKAFTALRAYGVTEAEALDIISNELVILQDYKTEQTTSLAPDLIDIFGAEHVVDALSYAYWYLERFKLNWDEYKDVLKTLLNIYKPEELIVNPEIIRYFLTRLKGSNKYNFENIQDMENDIIKKMTSGPYNPR